MTSSGRKDEPPDVAMNVSGHRNIHEELTSTRYPDIPEELTSTRYPDIPGEWNSTRYSNIREEWNSTRYPNILGEWNSTEYGNNTYRTTTKDPGEWDVVTDDFRLMFQIVNFAVICEIIDLFGTGTNIINIVCFIKQGFKDPVNISLLGLTISDLLSLVTLVWHNISVNPLLFWADIPFDPQDTVYLTGGIPHIGFTRVTSWITAFITLERCLCIALPLKIKTIVTPKRVTIAIIIIFVIIFAGEVVPMYYCTRFALVRHPFRKNRTWVGLRFTPDRKEVDRYSFAINNCFLPFTAFALITISTVVLVVKLRGKTNWRKKNTATVQSDSLSSRDQTVSKMVVMISTVFIICYTPVCVIFIGMIVVPKLSIDGTFGNMFAIVFSFAYILESINASFNIFIYYRVSSRYRQVFREAFCRPWDMEDNKGDKKPLAYELSKK